MHSSENMTGWQLVYEADSCVNAVYSRISLTVFLVIYNENMYSHGRAKISNLLNRLLHEFLGLTPAFNLTIFFCKVNIFLLLMN
jgi:hypothetical protein